MAITKILWQGEPANSMRSDAACFLLQLHPETYDSSSPDIKWLLLTSSLSLSRNLSASCAMLKEDALD